MKGGLASGDGRPDEAEGSATLGLGWCVDQEIPRELTVVWRVCGRNGGGEGQERIRAKDQEAD